MDRRTFISMVGATGAAGAAGCVGAGDDAGGAPDGGSDPTVETVADGLASPWGVAVPPDESWLLVTERPGRLLRVGRDGAAATVEGAPAVDDAGQGGLLDVALDPAFPDRRWVYLTYAAGDGTGRSTTHLGRGRLDADAAALREFEVLQVAEPFVDSDGHFGSRVACGPEGMVYVTVGDRQFKDFGPDHVAQDLGNHLGTTLRLRPDGSVPGDNPFVDDPDARDEIFSYGHRNAQGLALAPETGTLWESEFGEQDGDEINRLRAGANYGWPVADEGCTYGGGEPIGVSHDDRDDVVAPAYSWPCGSGGFPPSGAAVYDGDAVPEWQGDLFVAGLASRSLARFAVDDGALALVERLLAGRDRRLRAVAVGPETGRLYVAVDAADAPLLALS